MGTVTVPKSVTKMTRGAMGFYGDGKIKGFKMRVYKGSAAETYAKENGLSYEVIAASGNVKGDVTGDGKVDIKDLTKVAAHVKGKKSLSNASKADINGDGKVDIKDLTKIAAFIKGKGKL